MSALARDAPSQPWDESVDWTSGKVFFVNHETGAMQWSRPIAALATRSGQKEAVAKCN